MARIDEMITEIYDHEVVEIEGGLNERQRRRIEDRVLAAVMAEEFKESSSEAVIVPARKKKSRKRFLILGLAAVLLLGLCMTAFGKSYPDWDIELLRVMGLSSTDTLQLESGEVKIYESAICDAIEYIDGEEAEKKVVVTAVNSIGDKNSAFIRIDTDYKVPDDFDEKKDYIIPADADIKVYKKDPEKDTRETERGTTFSSEIRDGYLSFMVEISGCPNLNKSFVIIDMKDMYLCKDGLIENEEAEEKLLLEGEWHLKWKYEYKSNAKSYSTFSPIEIENQRYYVTKIEISPISVQINGFRMPWDREKEYVMFELDEILYEDGSKVVVNGSTSGGCRDRMWFDSFVGIIEIGEVIRTDEVDALIIKGNKMKIN